MDIVSKAATKEYQTGWDRIFGKKKEPVQCGGDGCQGCVGCMSDGTESSDAERTSDQQ